LSKVLISKRLQSIPKLQIEASTWLAAVSNPQGSKILIALFFLSFTCMCSVLLFVLSSLCLFLWHSISPYLYLVYTHEVIYVVTFIARQRHNEHLS
jgi:hypothetical protein